MAVIGCRCATSGTSVVLLEVHACSEQAKATRHNPISSFFIVNLSGTYCAEGKVYWYEKTSGKSGYKEP